ncbi:MAG TPA: quinolinate synthase NadA [Candidatus Saccharimonadales bacterium]|nr:quinolinate synthase NadA [Candidatus Saccharimonadales bacterium]
MCIVYTNYPRSEDGNTITTEAPAATASVETLRERLSPLGDPYRYGSEACREYAGIIERIRELKAVRRAVILAHNYQRPEIFEVADFVGDSLELSRRAESVDADVIVFCGVRFMAETAKVLNPRATVLIPDAGAGCTLADSVTAEALEERTAELKAAYPDLQVVTYVNTSAEVKAVSDVCCTSANAVRIVEAVPARHVLFVPDRNLAAYVQNHTDKTVISWDGNCYVHHQITPEQIRKVRGQIPGIRVLAHPECRHDVLEIADAVLSTSGMARYAKGSEADKFLVVTECGLSDRLLLEVPEKQFFKACKLCAYMKMTTLEGTLDSLESMTHEVTVEEGVRLRAKRALDRMLELGA